MLGDCWDPRPSILTLSGICKLRRKKIPDSGEFYRTKFIWLVDILFCAISTNHFSRYQYNGRQLCWWSSKRDNRVRGISAVFIWAEDFTFWKEKWPNLKLKSWQVLRKYGSVCGRAVNTSDSGSGDLEFKPRPSCCFLRQGTLLHFASIHPGV